MNPTISKEELTALYYKHKSCRVVGKIIGKSDNFVWKMLKHYGIQAPPKSCNVCSILLDEHNTYPSDWKKGARICKECRYTSINNQKNRTPEKQAEYAAISRLKLKDEVINAYGGKCECCGEEVWQFLTVDHIGGWGANHRREIGKSGSAVYQWLRKNEYPKDGFRLLCVNCNSCIGFHGFCPHQITNSINCADCNVLLCPDNQFNFHIVNNVSLCKICVLGRSIKRKTAKDITDNKYQTLEQRRKHAKNHFLNLRMQIIEGYGGQCECCGEKNYMFLTIDHINNDGAQERKSRKLHAFFLDLKKNNFPKDNYRLLCYNCNCSRGFYGQCYHELCEKLHTDSITISQYKDIISKKV